MDMNMVILVQGKNILTVSKSSSMKSRPRWQFWSKTHLPSAIDTLSRRRACTSWPWPIEIALQLYPSFFAKSMIFSVGSEPILRKQIMGVLFVDSACIVSMFRMTDSAYLAPIASAINFLAIGTILSGQKALMSNSLRHVSKVVE